MFITERIFGCSYCPELPPLSRHEPHREFKSPRLIFLVLLVFRSGGWRQHGSRESTARRQGRPWPREQRSRHRASRDMPGCTLVSSRDRPLSISSGAGGALAEDRLAGCRRASHHRRRRRRRRRQSSSLTILRLVQPRAVTTSVGESGNNSAPLRTDANGAVKRTNTDSGRDKLIFLVWPPHR